MISLQAYWVGTNKPIGLVQYENQGNAQANSCWLQSLVASLIDAKPKTVKIFLGSVATRPQLTPVLRTLHLKYPWGNDALKEAWASINATSSKVLDVYVTQHSAIDVAIDNLVFLSTTYGGVLSNYNNMSKELRVNPKVAFVAYSLNADPQYLLEIPEVLCKDKRFLLQLATANRENMPALRYAHPDLQDDKEFVYSILALAPSNWRYTHPDLRNDRNVVLAAMRVSGAHFALYAASFQNDREVVLAAVSSWGFALADVPFCFRDDKEVVLTALRAFPNMPTQVLRFASLALQNDDVLVLIK